jgi:hypothetical protein
MKAILVMIFVMVPVLWELYNDRNGDLNKKKDVFMRAMLFAWAGAVINILTGVSAVICILLSIGTFFLLFDYLIVIVLKHNKVISPTANWFTYLGKKGYVDNIFLWKRLGPWGRFITKVVVFTISLVLYLMQ